MTFRKIKNKFKHHFHEVIRVKKSPHSIALGFSIGTLIAILPTFGLGALIGIIVILIFEKVNKFSLFIAFAVWNMLTLMPIYLLSYKIGEILFGTIPVYKFKIVLLNQAYNFTRRFLVGNFILAIVISVLSYFFVKKLAQVYQKKHLKI